MDHDAETYERFVARFFETGAGDVDASWSPELRQRCRLFLLMHRSHSMRLASESLLGLLAAAGVGSQISLEESPSGRRPSPGTRTESPLADSGAAASPLTKAAEDPASEERYVVETELGRGGMGRVLLSYDRDFRRRIAMKVLLGSELTPARVARFFEEAQATAQLEHPNIAPVYDLGVDASGVPFFTMKWIRGRDLEELLRARGDGGVELSLVRVVQILQQVAMGIDFAHSRGVVHRDLKPQNVMVGDYGEVLVVDWGLAKILSRAAGASDTAEHAAVTTDRREMGVVSQDGHVVGSLAYMAPEQARGETDAIDARTDVFALGAILYRVLTGSPPYAGAPLGELLARAREGRIESPSSRAAGREIQPELDEICRRALAPHARSRYASAREFHDALQAWVEGIRDAERRAAEARRLLDEATAMVAEYRTADARLDRISRELDALERRIADHDSIEHKQPLWELQARAATARGERETCFAHATAAYEAVLRVDAVHRDARSALAGLYFERLVDAESHGDSESALLFAGLVRQYDTGELARALDGTGRLRLMSTPRADRIVVERYQARGPRLVAVRVATIDRAALDRSDDDIEIELAPGSYLATLASGTHEPATIPLCLERSANVALIVALHERGTSLDGFVRIAAGESIVGGDRDELASFVRQRVWVDEFFLARFPVTLGEFARFLDEVLTTVGAARLDELDYVPSFGKQRYLVVDEGGRFAPDRAGGLDGSTPVFGISKHAMLAYCGWLARRSGRATRLPTEHEWERAARGADGRGYPWGDGFDWALCAGGRSRPGQPAPRPIGDCPSDVSPFGVQDLAGGVRELCDGVFEEGSSPCRGGSWFQTGPGVFRAAARTMLRDGARTTDIGFRVAYSR